MDENKDFLKFCPNITTIYVKEPDPLLREDKEFLPKLQNIKTHISINDSNVNHMKILADKYSQSLKKVNTSLNHLNAEELKTCFDCFSQFENLVELKLHLYIMKTNEPIDSYLSLIGRKCFKILKLDLQIYQWVSISHRFFDTFTHFEAIKTLKIRLQTNTVQSGKCRMFQTLQTTHKTRYQLSRTDRRLLHKYRNICAETSITKNNNKSKFFPFLHTFV